MKTVGAYRRGDVPYVVLCNASPPIFRRALDPRGTRSKVSLAVTIIPAIVDGIGARYRWRLSTNRDGEFPLSFPSVRTIYLFVSLYRYFSLFPRLIDAPYISRATEDFKYFLPEAWYTILNFVHKALINQTSSTDVHTYN